MWVGPSFESSQEIKLRVENHKDVIHMVVDPNVLHSLTSDGSCDVERCPDYGASEGEWSSVICSGDGQVASTAAAARSNNST